jgi:hypothetical protein
MTEERIERRSEPRSRTLKAGRIVFNRRASVVTCTIRNMSSKGAKLVVSSQAGLPNSFELELESGGPPRSCRVIWRRDNEIGVNFVDP